jgi:hypothetical protein
MERRNFMKMLTTAAALGMVNPMQLAGVTPEPRGLGYGEQFTQPAAKLAHSELQANMLRRYMSTPEGRQRAPG